MPLPSGKLAINWNRRLRKMDDFFWPVLMLTPIGRKSVVEELVAKFEGAIGINVPYTTIENHAGDRPDDKTWPELKALWITCCLDADEDRSTIVRWVDDQGRDSIKISGIEKSEDGWNEEEFENFEIRKKRVPGHGLYVRNSDLSGCDFFRVNQNRFWLFCTDKVKQFVDAQGYAGLDFLEAGDVIE